MVKVSIFSIVVAVLLINIVLHHLINWWFRKAVKKEADCEVLVIVFSIFISLAISIAIISEVTS